MSETIIKRVGDNAYEVSVNGQRLTSTLTMEQVIEYLCTPEELEDAAEQPDT